VVVALHPAAEVACRKAHQQPFHDVEYVGSGGRVVDRR
jgi:hypothetical protein